MKRIKIIFASIATVLFLNAYAASGAVNGDLEPDTMWTYKHIDGKDLQMSVFLPDNYENAGPFPAIVIFHGGSWTAGEASWQYPDCEYWSKRGMIAVSVDYRLKERDGVEVPLECVKDAKSAIRFLRQNAEELKVDAEKLVAAGSSAGGQLAAAMATIKSESSNDSCYDVSISCSPNALILYNPYFKCAPELSPPEHITEGLPPTITFIGDQDPVITVGSMNEFHEALKQKGNASELYIGEGGKHGFCNGLNSSNPFFYWSLELGDRFLVKHGILSGASLVKIPEGVINLLNIPAQDTTAAWLSGSWGVRLLVQGGLKLDNNRTSDWVAGAQDIVDNLPTVGHVITNLTHPAHGYYFTLRDNPYVDIANEIHPDFVPTLENEQMVLEAYQILKDAGIKIILYIATDGPSARSGTPDNAEYKAAWESYYNAKFGGDEGLAYRTLIKGFCERFKGIADGYWLDHVSGLAGTMDDFVTMIRSVDSTVAIAANTIVENENTDFVNYYEDASGNLIYVDSDGLDDKNPRDYKVKSFDVGDPWSDYTGGHPTPLAQGAPPNSWAYEELTHRDMIAEPLGTYDGSKNCVKHAWVPMRTTWTGVRSDLMFEVEQAYRFVRKLTDSGASMTWGNTNTGGFITKAEMDIMKEIDRRLQMDPMIDYIPYTRPAGAKFVGETFDDDYQYIYFPEITSKKVGDAPFKLEAEASSGLPVTYTIINTDVAIVIEGKIHIIADGNTLITASQAGNADFSAASDVTQRLTVTPETDLAAINLALKGTATQSSDNSGGGGEAYRANDGNTNGAYSAGSVTRTEIQQNPWWQVDLGSEYSIGEISVFGRTDECCNTRLNNFTVYVFNSAGDTTFSKTYTTYPDPSLTCDAGGVQGKIVQVLMHASSVLNLAEVQVFTVPFEASFNVTDEANNSIAYAALDIHNRHYTTNTQGAATAVLPGGAYYYTLSKKGYYSLSQTLDITKDTALNLQLTAKPQYSLSFKVIDDSTNTDLSGALFTIDDQDYTTDSRGEISLTLFEDEYDYSLSLTGYHPLNQSVNLVKDTIVTLKLDRTKHNLEIQVEDAETEENLSAVSMNINEVVYETDAQGDLSLVLDYGAYNYTLSKTGYDSLHLSINLVKDTIVSLQMEKVWYELGFQVTDSVTGEKIPAASIAVNDSVYVADAQGILDLTVLPGVYTYTISNEAYETVNDSVSVNQDTILYIRLSLTDTKVSDLEANGIKVYPNPVNDILTLSMSDSQKASCKIFNIEGQCIHASDIEKGENLVDLGGISSGVYMLMIFKENQVFTKKIVKNL